LWFVNQTDTLDGFELNWGLNSLYTPVLYDLTFYSISFIFLSNLVHVYIKRRKWYLRPKLTSSHDILQVSACMRDTCPRGAPQRWRGYHFFKFFIIIILMISYIYIINKIWGSPATLKAIFGGGRTTPKGQNGVAKSATPRFFFFYYYFFKKTF